MLIAEDITSRFLNVIGLFNGHIPIMALQLSAVETADGMGLVFTRVLDTVRLGFVDEDEAVSETTDRNYWETTKASSATVQLADEVLKMCRSFAPSLTPSYKKIYIGFRLNNQAFNFAVCKPRAQSMSLELSLPQSDELDAEIKSVGLELLAYNRHFSLYRISLKASDLPKQQVFLTSLLKRAFDNRS